MKFDYVIVGSGFAGATIAERVATVLDKKVLIIERRNHIGGNAYDSFDNCGVLIHNYGPHIFHTKIKKVWDYLSQFTEWRPYHHRVLGSVDGHLIPIPFSLNSLYSVFPHGLAHKIEEKLLERFHFNAKVPILNLLNEEDEDLKFLADYIYNKIFLNYTKKQWDVTPQDIDPTVTARVPFYLSQDDRYFQDPYQAMPKHGFTKMFESMLYRKNIHILLNTDYKDVLEINKRDHSVKLFGEPFEGRIIYTGPIDYFHDYKFGNLPYRSLRFEFENLREEYYQSVGTVNYPNDYDFTRITEFKHLTQQKAASTTIVREYPEEYKPHNNIPYYPIKNNFNHKLYRRYYDEGKLYKNVYFVGRLAEYQYYDMDAVVSKALKVFEENLVE